VFFQAHIFQGLIRLPTCLHRPILSLCDPSFFQSTSLTHIFRPPTGQYAPPKPTICAHSLFYFRLFLIPRHRRASQTRSPDTPSRSSDDPFKRVLTLWPLAMYPTRNPTLGWSPVSPRASQRLCGRMFDCTGGPQLC